MDPTAAPPHNYASYPSLKDRSVLVTGGADGVGAGIVEEFVRQGSKVGFLDINANKAEETLARLEGLSPAHSPRFYQVDLTDIPATQQAVSAAITDLEGIEVLVNNAASDDRHTWEEITPEYWNDRLNVNLRHYFFTIQSVAPQMIEAGAGSIINIGSSSFMMQEDFFPGYAIAKSGVSGITRTMARTFGPRGVRMNTVLPGWVATEKQLTKWWTTEGEAGTLRDQAIKRRIYPAEFAQLVLFLAADDGGACTAQEFLVDGGRF